MKRLSLTLVLLLPLLLGACRQQDDPTPTPVQEAADPAPTNTARPTPTTRPTETEAPAPAETAAPEPIRSQWPPAEVVNDEGGAVSLSGEVSYTNPFFTLGVAAPVIILEDQTGFVQRDDSFLMPVKSQTLGQITSDFFDSPFSYSLALPIEPQGLLNDVDQDGEDDLGLQVFAVAYWTNTFGDPFLEERDLYGGGWSTAYASTRTSEEAETEREIIGGKLLVYAPDDQQGFPGGFGDDGLLFTADDPIVQVPQGYSVVDLDSEPFIFDRSRNQTVDLIEPEGAALVDYSDLSYSEAFQSLIDQMSLEYAFTDLKNIDWEALRQQFLPRFEEAEERNSTLAYQRALRDFAWAIPDGHISGPLVLQDFQESSAGGLGIAIRDVDDGRTIVNFLLPNSPADDAGIELGAQILSINGQPIDEYVSQVQPFSAPFSTDHVRRLQQLRYATRFELGTQVEVAWRNADESQEESAELIAVPERESFSFSSLNSGLSGFEQPVEYERLAESGFGYVQIFSFSDNSLLTVQLWERLLREMNEDNVPGLIVDMRQNGGGSGFLANQLAAYFFDEALELGNTARYDEDRQSFYFDPRNTRRFYLPAEELRYRGELVVIVGPSCASACEFFSYATTLKDRATVVGQYPTAGLGGSITQVAMPDGESFVFTTGRAVDPDGNIHIEGQGVAPDLRVPVTPDTLLSIGDPVLAAAVSHLNQRLLGDIVDGGEIALGEALSGELAPGERIRYTARLQAGNLISLFVDSDQFEPELGLYDAQGNLIGTTEEAPTPNLEGLAIPANLALQIEVFAADEAGGGSFRLRLVEESP
ncbi:MAG: S41 family peptidase [Candidatus Promineifilaceae bacterium]|nr:S41 family peptidase [Candidatus Promineifilaceae bacterium]